MTNWQKKYDESNISLSINGEQIKGHALPEVLQCRTVAIEVAPLSEKGTRRFRLYAPNSLITVEVEVYSTSPTIWYLQKLVTTPIAKFDQVKIGINGNIPEIISDRLSRFFRG